jgi:hypothetical protein
VTVCDACHKDAYVSARKVGKTLCLGCIADYHLWCAFGDEARNVIDWPSLLDPH